MKLKKNLMSAVGHRTDVFELHVQFKVMKLRLSIQRNYKIFYFQVFPKDPFRTHSNI